MRNYSTVIVVNINNPVIRDVAHKRIDDAIAGFEDLITHSIKENGDLKFSFNRELDPRQLFKLCGIRFTKICGMLFILIEKGVTRNFAVIPCDIIAAPSPDIFTSLSWVDKLKVLESVVKNHSFELNIIVKPREFVSKRTCFNSSLTSEPANVDDRPTRWNWDAFRGEFPPFNGRAGGMGKSAPIDPKPRLVPKERKDEGEAAGDETYALSADPTPKQNGVGWRPSPEVIYSLEFSGDKLYLTYGGHRLVTCVNKLDANRYEVIPGTETIEDQAILDAIGKELKEAYAQKSSRTPVLTKTMNGFVIDLVGRTRFRELRDLLNAAAEGTPTETKVEQKSSEQLADHDS